MPPFIQFVIRRFLSIPVSLLVITLILYGGVMLTPPEARAALYMPENIPARAGEQALKNMQERIIEQYHLRAPFPVQYFYWLKSLADGSWGYSPALNDYVLPSLLRRTPATLELAFYSLLLLVPIGLISGVTAGWKRGGMLTVDSLLVKQLLPDLAQLVKKYRRDPQVWQTLGDALTRIGDQEHASQSYAQARKYSR